MSNLTSRAVIIGGPQVLNNDIKVLDILLENYDKTIKRKLIYTQFRNLRKFSDDEKAVFEKHGYKYEEHLDIIHDLRIPVNEQWMKIHGGRRKNIRRAEKNGLVFREILNESEFWKAYDLVTKTYDRVKLPMPDKSLFREIFLQMGGTGSFKTFVALNTIEIIATRMVFCYKDLIYDWYAGASDKHSDKYPNDFLPWKVIEWGSQNGYKFFDFGGAGKPDVPYGVRDHKLKFGGELVEFGRFEKIHKPVLMKFGILGLKLIKSGQNGLRK
ncbi:MAG: GNAT family N-acetyltransferase [Bacteroidales bacterium]|nr:GNAT family N-acetyltransferase [Bacteroidales bacterium]